MRLHIKLFSLLFMVVFSLSFLFAISSASGEEFIPPVPDSNTLPANDGGPDGCDSSRFKCVLDGEAVLDNQTGLVWARNTEILEKSLPWQEAVNFCDNLEIGGKKGWRLPTKDEIISISDTSQSNPALPEGHPFKKMREFEPGKTDIDYWTITEYEGYKPSGHQQFHTSVLLRSCCYS